MRRFDFTDEQRQAIARDRYQHVDPRVQRRMELLWLKAHGETHERYRRVDRSVSPNRATLPRHFRAGGP